MSHEVWSEQAERGVSSEPPGRHSRPRLRAVGLLAVIAVVAVAGFGWTVKRAALDDGGVDAPPAEVSAAVVVARGDGELSGPVQSECAPPLAWEALGSFPALAAVVDAAGQADVCLDVYRVTDEDAAKDYYRAVASGWWTTESSSTRWPWQEGSEPAGDVWVGLEWSLPAVDHYWQTRWAWYTPCEAVGMDDPVELQGLEPAGGAQWCSPGSSPIGQPVADDTHVTWSVAAPQDLDATAMVLDIAVPEGAVPHFSLEVRQVPLDG